MHKGRLEAFSDGVIAIIITIMVLEMKVPHGENVADLIPIVPIFLGYVLSFVYLGIYWNNHHHLLQAAKTVSGKVLWANLHLLFWLSLIPFTTGWMSENHFGAAPVALYGVVLFFAAIAYFILTLALISTHGRESALAKAIGRDVKGIISLGLYAVAIGFSLWWPWAAMAIYVLVALIWLIPDTRIERTLHH